MGAWGYHPIESDQGQEFLEGSLKGVDRKIRKGLKAKLFPTFPGTQTLGEKLGYR